MNARRPIVARLAPLLVFFLGLVAGVAISAWWVASRLHTFVENGPADLARLGVAAVTRELDLDAAQRTQLAPLILRIESTFAAMHRDDLARVRDLFENAAVEARPHLRPEQQARLDAMLADPRRRWDKFLGNTSTPSSTPGFDPET